MAYQTIGSSDVSWAGKTYSEIGEIGERDGSIAVVPMGSVEQHGHHMPVGTDTILVDAAAHLGAERVHGEVPVLVTPTEWVGSSPHHMSLGGTITGDYGTLLDLLGQITDCVIDNGFDAVLVVNGHGGNKSLVASVPRIVGPAHYPDVDIRACTYFELPDEETIARIRRSDPGGAGHAGEFETSLMLYLRPDLVDESSLEGTTSEGDMFGEGSPVASYGEFGDVSETGAIGDPEVSSAEAGEQFYEEVGDRLEELLREIHADNA
jgi:creatinine amidohydrolase